MSRRRVTVTLTARQASLLWTLADMAGEDHDLRDSGLSGTEVLIARRAMAALLRAASQPHA